jgi:hypothetical protein
MPTWRNLYDWPNGHGYVGWYTASSSQTGAYRAQAALGGQYGLWLWPAGGSSYSYSNDNYVEWTYTAPGTTRIANAQVLFAYKNKLLAHHCIDVGFRTGTTIVYHNEHCKPAAPPDSQRQVAVSLVDPSTNPTTKTLYFRIRVDCGGATTCSKNIPALDPLSTGGFARLLRVDMTLVDDDDPVVTPSGPFFELAETTIDGSRAYDLTITARDAGSGIQRVWVEQQNDELEQATGSEIASSNAPCDPTHRTPALDNRICPEQHEFTTSIDTTQLADGVYTYIAKAIDLAANIGESAPWTIEIDRTPSGGPPAADVARAIDIATHDPRLIEVVGGRPYSVALDGVWLGETDDPIGIELTVSWTDPATLEYNWPLVDFGSIPYGEGTLQFTSTNVTELDVLVDLARGALVSMEPGGDAESTSSTLSTFELQTAVTDATGDTGGTTAVLRRVYLGNDDWVWNYDFDTAITPGTADSRNHVDWPIDLIFWGNADVDKAKQGLSFHEACNTPHPPDCDLSDLADPMFAYVHDAAGPSDPRSGVFHGTMWDHDLGAVRGIVCAGTKRHYRVYAPAPAAGGDDRMYNLSLQFYVVGSAHKDVREGCAFSWSGDSEKVESYIAKNARDHGWLVRPRAIRMYNAEDQRRKKRKHFRSDGYATLLKVP